MTRALRAELRRIRLRTVTWLVLGLLLVVAVGFVVTAWDDARPRTAAEVAAAHEAYESDVRRMDEMMATCRVMLAESPDSGLDCDIEPAPESSYLWTGRSFDEALTEATGGLAVPLAVAALVAAVSFVTAEFGARTIAPWLVVVPRRGRVVLSKTSAAALVSVPGALVTVLATVAGLTALYAGFGRPLASGYVWTEVTGQVGREIVLVVLAAVAGTGLAFALRHATAVLGVLVWWVVAIEVTLPVVLPRGTPLTVATNANAWLEGGTTYFLQECGPDPENAALRLCQDVEHTVSAVQGLDVLVVLVVLVALCGALVFRQRDVV